MIGDICDATPGADKHTTLHAVGRDSRVGLKYLRPGFGFGGPCFPRDNRALAGFAASVGVEAMVSHVTDKYNGYHTRRQANALLAQGREHYPIPLLGKAVKVSFSY